MENDARTNHKKAGVAILISEKTVFKIRSITREKEINFRMVKDTIHHEKLVMSA